jgi:DNA-directed RNA polymerase specialized sigma24 family protein
MVSKSKSELELLESIDQRLKTLIRLKIQDEIESYETTKEKVKVLNELGFNNSEMAEIIGTSEGSVSGTLSRLRSNGEIDD